MVRTKARLETAEEWDMRESPWGETIAVAEGCKERSLLKEMRD